MHSGVQNSNWMTEYMEKSKDGNEYLRALLVYFNKIHIWRDFQQTVDGQLKDREWKYKLVHVSGKSDRVTNTISKFFRLIYSLETKTRIYSYVLGRYKHYQSFFFHKMYHENKLMTFAVFASRAAHFEEQFKNDVRAEMNGPPPHVETRWFRSFAGYLSTLTDVLDTIHTRDIEGLEKCIDYLNSDTAIKNMRVTREFHAHCILTAHAKSNTGVLCKLYFQTLSQQFEEHMGIKQPNTFLPFDDFLAEALQNIISIPKLIWHTIEAIRALGDFEAHEDLLAKLVRLKYAWLHNIDMLTYSFHPHHSLRVLVPCKSAVVQYDVRSEQDACRGGRTFLGNNDHHGTEEVHLEDVYMRIYLSGIMMLTDAAGGVKQGFIITHMNKHHTSNESSKLLLALQDLTRVSVKSGKTYKVHYVQFEFKTANHLHLWTEEIDYYFWLTKRLNFGKAKSLEGYTDYSYVNSGAFGSVYRVAGAGRPDIAVKVLSKSKYDREGREKLRREIAIAVDCSHSKFVSALQCSFETLNYICLIYDYAISDLSSVLKSPAYRADPEFIAFYGCELIIAIDFLHNLRIAHNDLKPDNILISKNYHLKVCDFGESFYSLPLLVDNFDSTVLVGGHFQAPERNLNLNRNYKSKLQPMNLVTYETGLLCDWFPVGGILYEMLYGGFKSVLEKYFEPENTERSAVHLNVVPSELPAEYRSHPEGVRMFHRVKTTIDSLLNMDPRKRLMVDGQACEPRQLPIFADRSSWDAMRARTVLPPRLIEQCLAMVHRNPVKEPPRDKKNVNPEQEIRNVKNHILSKDYRNMTFNKEPREIFRFLVEADE